MNPALNKLNEKIAECYNIPLKKDAIEHIKIKLNSEIINLGHFKNTDNQYVDFIFTKSELIQKWIELQTDYLSGTFVDTMQYSYELISAIKDSLSGSDLDFAEYIFDNFYSEYLNGDYNSEGIDVSYRKLNGIGISYFYNNIINDFTHFDFVDFFDDTADIFIKEKIEEDLLNEEGEEDEEDDEGIDLEFFEDREKYFYFCLKPSSRRV